VDGRQRLDLYPLRHAIKRIPMPVVDSERKLSIRVGCHESLDAVSGGHLSRAVGAVWHSRSKWIAVRKLPREGAKRGDDPPRVVVFVVVWRATLSQQQPIRNRKPVESLVVPQHLGPARAFGGGVEERPLRDRIFGFELVGVIQQRAVAVVHRRVATGTPLNEFEEIPAADRLFDPAEFLEGDVEVVFGEQPGSGVVVLPPEIGGRLLAADRTRAGEVVEVVELLGTGDRQIPASAGIQRVGGRIEEITAHGDSERER